MPKYLVQASYTAEGARGLLKDGGKKRKDAVRKLMKSVGGKLDSMYFCFGGSDVVMIIDAPSNEAMAAGALAAVASGAVRPTTTVLLTPEEIDEAVKLTPTYSAPGR